MYIVAATIALIFLGACRQGDPGTYIPGGRNIEAHFYAHTDGYPTFPDRAAFLGVVSGDWYSMGRKVGETSGASTRFVSDIWWKELCEMYGKEASLKAFDLYVEQIANLDPGLVEFMKGIADGASEALAESPYADENHPLHATAYERVLAVNMYDEWGLMHPRQFPDGTDAFGGGAVKEPPVIPHMTGCSAFAARGRATLGGETISAHNRHSPYDPRCYEQVYILRPDDGYACWVLSNSPQVAGNQVVNEHGVSISLLFGGLSNPRSLGHPDGPFVAEAFGVPWFHLFIYAGTHARSAEEAIEMMTKGTEAYRKRARRKSLLRCGGWVFLVADATTLAVVEATADRYAVRYAGDLTTFTGPDWTDEDYIVATNHYICDFSHDENNQKTGLPMTIFNEGCFRDPQTGEVTRLTESGVRFWTLMWDLRHYHGQVDRYRAQQIMSGTYAYEAATGERIEVAEGNDGKWYLFGRVNLCTAGRISYGAGTCDSKIAVIGDPGTSVSWTMGNPIHWRGAWDRFDFSADTAYPGSAESR